MAAAAADWSNLNKDMVEVIANKFDSCTDYVRFRAVLHGWKSCLPENPPKPLLQRRYPYLLLPSNSPSSPNFSLLSSLDLDGKVVDQLQLTLAAGKGDNFNFRGFSKGWLIAIEKEGPSIYLINPFTREQKLLPPVNTFPDVFRYYPNRVGNEFVIRRDPSDRVKVHSFSRMYSFFVEKVVISSPPTGTNCVAMAIYGEFMDLGYCKYGDKEWTRIDTGGYSDVICYKDKFYAVNPIGEVTVVDVSNSGDSLPTAIRIAGQPPSRVNCAMKLYLVMVESSSRKHHLLLVARYVDWKSDLLKLEVDSDEDVYETHAVEVFKLNLNLSNIYRMRKWFKRSKSLDNVILFLGCNESVSFPSIYFPGCQRDHIHFTDDYFEGHRADIQRGGYDNAVFNFQNKTIKRLQGYQPPQSLWPPPIWVMHQSP